MTTTWKRRFCSVIAIVKTVSLNDLLHGKSMVKPVKNKFVNFKYLSFLHTASREGVHKSLGPKETDKIIIQCCLQLCSPHPEALGRSLPQLCPAFLS